MKKKILVLFMILSLCLATAIPVAFAKDITVTLNGNKISFDVPPQIVSDRTMVPMRAIFEAFGYDVSWQQSTQKITAKGSSGTITMQINNYYINKNSDSVYTDVAPLIIDGRTLVPLRAISELLDCSVDWNGSTQTVTISSAGEKASSSNQNTSVSILDIDNISGEKFYNADTRHLTDNYGNTYSDALYSFEDNVFQALLNGKYSKFKCTLYTPKGIDSKDTTIIIIKADGKTVYKSPELTKTSKPLDVDVNIKGCNDFQIQVKTDGWHEVGFIGEGMFYK